MATSAMPVTNVLGQLIRERRLALGISQAELGRQLGGFTRQLIHAVEVGTVGLRSLDGRALRPWARALRIGVRALRKARLVDALARVRVDDSAGGWLRRERVRKGRSQKDVARAVGCSQGTLSLFERGQLRRSLRLEERVRRALHDTHPR